MSLFLSKCAHSGLIVPTHVGLEVCRVVVFGLARHCQPERAGSWNINRDFEYGPSTPSTTLALAPGGRGLHRATKGGGVGVRASGSQSPSISRGAKFAGWALGSRGPMADAPALAAMRLPRSALVRRGQLEGRWMLPVRSSFRACPKHQHHARQPGGERKRKCRIQVGSASPSQARRRSAGTGPGSQLGRSRAGSPQAGPGVASRTPVRTPAPRPCGVALRLASHFVLAHSAALGAVTLARRESDSEGRFAWPLSNRTTAVVRCARWSCKSPSESRQDRLGA